MQYENTRAKTLLIVILHFPFFKCFLIVLQTFVYISNNYLNFSARLTDRLTRVPTDAYAYRRREGTTEMAASADQHTAALAEQAKAAAAFAAALSAPMPVGKKGGAGSSSKAAGSDEVRTSISF